MPRTMSIDSIPTQYRTADLYGGSAVPPEPEYTEAELEGMRAYEQFIQDMKLRREIRKRNDQNQRNGRPLL